MDVETDLPNLQNFKVSLAEWIEARETGFVAIIHPTELNTIVDLYGRKAGAELLRQMADRMREYLPTGEELISRISNSLILGIKGKPNQFTSHYKHVEPLTQIPFFVGGKENYITLKIGYTTFDKTMSVEQCIHQADIALTKARHRSGTSFAIYEDNTTKLLTEEMEIFNHLAYALQHDEFESIFATKNKLYNA